MRLGTVQEAMAISGHTAKETFRSFVWRINRTVPQEAHIVRVNGRYDLDSIEAGIRAYSYIKSQKGHRTAAEMVGE